MSTRKLNGVDFMMMDVHRPLTNDEVEEINPQAAVDKSVGPFEDKHSAAEGVDAPYPEARCKICFGPMPCEQHANVEIMTGITSLDVPVERMLAHAHAADMEVLVLVGIRKNGKEFFASSCANAAEAMYHLQRGIFKLNMIIDSIADKADNDDDTAA